MIVLAPGINEPQQASERHWSLASNGAREKARVWATDSDGGMESLRIDGGGRGRECPRLRERT
jgi:hypothetical protein